MDVKTVDGAAMDPDATERLCRDFFDDVWCRGNADAVGKYMAAHARCHRFGLPPGDAVPAYSAYVAQVHEAFPDLRIELAEVIASEGRAACRYQVTGTHEGEFIGIPATGRTVSFIGLAMAHCEDGKIVEEWSEDDAIAIFNQLGVLGIDARL